MKTPTIDIPYVTDGLLFYIDGYDFEEGFNWIPKVGNTFFKNVGNVTKLENGGVLFDGNSYMKGEAGKLINLSDVNLWTFEICAKWNQDPSETIYYAFFGGCAIGIVKEVGKIASFNHAIEQLHNTGRAVLSQDELRNKFTTSASFSSAYVNTKYSYTNSSNVINSYDTSICIGGRESRRTKCEIYAIRIYNRILSEDEILHNQSEDIKRYNIEL